MQKVKGYLANEKACHVFWEAELELATKRYIESKEMFDEKQVKPLFQGFTMYIVNFASKV